jgi:UDP-N-acetylglucosamine/UDP-N-acetylgalactosamine diphosphorylase
MRAVSPELRRRLRNHGQEHVLTWWEHVTETERVELERQLLALDLDMLAALYAQREQHSALPAQDRITPIPVVRQKHIKPEMKHHGEAALRRGEIAVLLVAGGQGSRLGFEHPKGMYPIGPVTSKPLFQIHAEKVLALSRRYETPIPFLIMTSPATDLETRTFFADHHWFGLPADDVFFFAQGTMPALDLATGKLLLEKPGRLFTSPNGHGGTLLALAETGLLDQMRQRGIRQVFYFQVDNPLVKVADPAFLGYHEAARAEASSKIVPKNGPTDKLGNLVLIDGRCSIIEYSDLPHSLAEQREADGSLRFWVGSPAIHIFELDFLDKVTRGRERIPFHLARKKVPYLDENGTLMQPERENALKFEMFIFDALPRADRWTVVETSRADEFEPLKNSTGSDSPESVRRAMSNLFGGWLEAAHVPVPRRPDGNVAVSLEISPLFALDAQELAGRIKPGLKVEGPTYFD